ncbi:MAG: SMC family ATPase [Chloroflexi bacterium]|nr:SMC family ATPase [Chloroflexota bacterium]
MIRLKRLYAHNFKQLQELELHFPDGARILVQGKNEAGKSTLFEAVFFALFGAALATETGARGLEGLIAYATEKARVELDLACGDRLFKITRTIVRGKANTWELDVVRDGAAPEEIRGNTAVNKRLVAELGFDGDALLNTCFVEQKKLEKLEGLSRAKREESLAKLLNLDALVDLENDLKIRAEDKQELERLKKRAELADIQSDLPAREQELTHVESRLQLIDLRRAVEGAAEEMKSVQQLDALICDLIARRDATAQRVEQIDAVKEAMLGVKEARDAVERLAEGAAEIARLTTELADARRAVAEGEQLQARGQSLARLGSFLSRLDQVGRALESNAQRVAQLTATQARLLELNTTIAREEQAMAQLETRLGQFEVGEALGDWIAARRAMVTQDESEGRVKAMQQGRDQLSQRFRVEIYGLAALLLIFVVAAAVVQTLTAGLIALASATLVALAIRVTLLWRDLSRAAEQLGQAEGEARARAATNETQLARLREIESRLRDLGATVPESPDLAQSQRVEIARGMESRTRDELRAEQDAARERLSNARAVLGELQDQHALQDTTNLQHELERCQRVAQKAEAILARWRPRIEGLAQALSVDSNPNGIQRALYQLDARREQIQRRMNDAARLVQEIARREQQAERLAAQARDAYDKSRRRKPGAPPWNPEWTVNDYNSLGKELRTEYDALGGEALIKQAREIEGELGRRQGERESRARNAAVLVGRTQELLRGIGRADELSSPPELAVLEDLRERFQAIDLGDEATLRGQQRQLVGRLHSLRDRQAQLERDLGLSGQALDRAACRAEFEEKSRQASVRERGVELVSLARRRIVQKVLPATMDYMRQILPTLTRDRYHDAQLDSESYKIQVWDERAGPSGAFKEKNIFSGGTKDQFSLALRLAFALATLPQERGSAPSFIFLDEPLGSFDQERADALIYLLTEGEIARAFDQIFLISHVHVDERLFTHRVILENGRVQFSDLPAP